MKATFLYRLLAIVTFFCSTSALAAITCSVTTQNVWVNGYQLEITVKNTGPQAVTSWAVKLNFAEPPLMTGNWNGVFTVNGLTMNVANWNSGWSNGNLTVGQTTTFGFQGNHDGSFVLPTCASADSGVALTAPAKPNVATASMGSYLVSWPSIAGATNYTLQEAELDSAGLPKSWVTLQDTASLQFSIADKPVGRFAYRVRQCAGAQNCSDYSAVSNVRVFKIYAPLTNTGGKYTVTWVGGEPTSQLLENGLPVGLAGASGSYTVKKTTNASFKYTLSNSGTDSTTVVVSAATPASNFEGKVAVVGAGDTKPLFAVSPVPYSPIVGEPLLIDWFAYSANSQIASVSWVKTSGPDAIITSSSGLLKVTANAPGTLVISGLITDVLGKTSSVQVQYVVQAPYSSKAKLLQGRSDGVGIDLVIVGDGFTASQQQDLLTAAQNFMMEFFNTTKLEAGNHRPLWNVWLVESISATSAIGGGNTLFNSFFNCGNIDRLLCVRSDSEVLSYAATYVPQYDHVLVAVNSTTYGGAGGRVATFSLSPSASQVAIHELGHSYAGLADEYDYGALETDPLPFENSNPDITVNTDPRTVKWKHWIADINSIPGFDRVQTANQEVGYFQGGAYRQTRVWRPTFTSLMRELGQPLGAVNTEVWTLRAWQYSQNINVAKPVTNFQSALVVNAYTVPTIAGANLEDIVWKINGAVVTGAQGKNFLVTLGASHSTDTVEVSLKDNTGYIRVNPNKYGEAVYTFKSH